MSSVENFSQSAKHIWHLLYGTEGRKPKLLNGMVFPYNTYFFFFSKTVKIQTFICIFFLTKSVYKFETMFYTHNWSFIPITSKKLTGHIAFGSFIHFSICSFIMLYLVSKISRKGVEPWNLVCWLWIINRLTFEQIPRNLNLLELWNLVCWLWIKNRLTFEQIPRNLNLLELWNLVCWLWIINRLTFEQIPRNLNFLELWNLVCWLWIINRLTFEQIPRNLNFLELYRCVWTKIYYG